ncbi:hypothetical protein U14_03269 [Candidatus Moduliflexus flocculans]|uniref:DUF1349 domain-containing protein n=1 Tax=Candidatus Moduliflexus flocculans TaxID=1499966 RepID=A0A081BNQ6_9BACT|nr:hypothetical protein U14_03269 [Candidatus Moduliflexus flocculans]
MNIFEEFTTPTLPSQFYWFNEPARVVSGQGLELWTKPKTDFWQRSHYGFRRDDGHCLFTDIDGDFCVTAKFEWNAQTQYDQCGLMARIDAENWLKTSTEYETASLSRLGSVVTNFGYSDWATQDVDSDQTRIWYRLSRHGQDFKIEASYDGDRWRQLRITHLHNAGERLAVGIYACSPIGENFWSRVISFRCEPNHWAYRHE